MQSKELSIEGMSCTHCVMHVKKELAKVPGLEIEEVKIGSAKVRLDETKVTSETLAAAVTTAGYKLAGVK